MLRRLSKLVKGNKSGGTSKTKKDEMDPEKKQDSKIQVEEKDQPPLAQHDSSILDLAFVMDCTGSMGSYIENARNNIRKIVEDIVANEKSDVRLALVEYRDHPPEDSSFVTRPHDFTAKVGKMKSWLEGCSADGGGDTPEAVADGLHQLLKLSWRDEATKIAVLIADAPPHGLGCSGDGFRKGCPDGLDPMKVTADLAKKGVTLYVAGCEPCIRPYKDFFAGIAYMTGGQYVPLAAAKSLTQIIIGGAREEISLEQWMEEVNRQVKAEVDAAGANNFDEEAFTRRLADDMVKKGVKTKRLERNKGGLGSVSKKAKDISIMTSLTDVRAAVEVERPSRKRKSKRLALFSSKEKKPDLAESSEEEYSECEDEDIELEGSAMERRSSVCSEDSYDCASVSIQFNQVERMVHRSKMRNASWFKGGDSD